MPGSNVGSQTKSVRRMSLNGSKMKLVERDIPIKIITVQLATVASIRVRERVVSIHYTLEEQQ